VGAEKFLRGPRIISEPGATLAKLIARYVAGESWDDPVAEVPDLPDDRLRRRRTDRRSYASSHRAMTAQSLVPATSATIHGSTWGAR